MQMLSHQATCETKAGSYCLRPLTVAWRSILLPARCFTSTLSFGVGTNFTSFIRELLKADQEGVRRSTSAKKRSRGQGIILRTVHLSFTCDRRLLPQIR